MSIYSVIRARKSGGATAANIAWRNEPNPTRCRRRARVVLNGLNFDHHKNNKNEKRLN